MQIEAEEIGHEAMIAGAVDRQTALEFLVAVLAFAALGVVVVGSLGDDAGTGPVGDDETAIGPLGVGLGLDDDPAGTIPRTGLIPEGVAESLRRFRLGVSVLGFSEQFLAFAFEHGIAGDAKEVLDAEPLADGIQPRHTIAG